MKYFAAVNEYSELGYKLIPYLLLFSDNKPNVWAPAAGFIERTHEQDKRCFSKKTFMEAVDAGLIQVCARDTYYDKKNIRSSQFTEGQWDEEFDGTLALWAKRESLYPDPERGKIRLFPKEQGYNWADKVIAEKKEIVIQAYSLCEELFNSFSTAQNPNLPAGVINKMRHAATNGSTLEEKKDYAVRQLLRDCYNNAQDYGDVGSNVYLRVTGMENFCNLMNLTRKMDTPPPAKQIVMTEMNNLMEIEEIEDSLERLRKIKNDRDLLKFFCNNKETDILRKSIQHYALEECDTNDIESVYQHLRVPDFTERTNEIVHEKMSRFISLLAGLNVSMNTAAYKEDNPYSEGGYNE